MRARRSARPGEQVVQGAGVVAEDGAFANAEAAAAFDVHDVAGFERLGRALHRLAAGGDRQVAAGGGGASITAWARSRARAG